MVRCDGECGEVGRQRGWAIGWVVKRGVYVSGMGMVGEVDTEFSPLSFVSALVK